MIFATAATDGLFRSLNVRAADLARMRTETMKQNTRSGPANWRSATALWPDLELD